MESCSLSSTIILHKKIAHLMLARWHHLMIVLRVSFSLSYTLRDQNVIWEKVHDNYNNYYDEQQHHNLFSYRIEKISSVFAITCIVLAFVYILFAIIYTTCGGMSDDGDIYYDERRNWANYEMSTHHHTGRGGSGGGGGGGDRLRHRSRRKMRNATDKQEPLMGSGMPPGAITDNEGFITDMVSTSSGSSMGSNPWEREKQFSGTLT